MPIKDMIFPASLFGDSWVPASATEHFPWGEAGDSGTFVYNGDRFVYFLIDSRLEYNQYVVGEFPEDYEPYVPNPSPEVLNKVKASVLVRDRQIVHVYGEIVQTGFFYGVRFCKPCIICGKELETVNNTDDYIAEQPSGGTNFKASGHYGSGVFDPMSGESLSINICDECLIGKGTAGLVTHIVNRQKVIDNSVRTDWKMENYDGPIG